MGANLGEGAAGPTWGGGPPGPRAPAPSPHPIVFFYLWIIVSVWWNFWGFLHYSKMVGIKFNDKMHKQFNQIRAIDNKK
jgi:hypothetical protein